MRRFIVEETGEIRAPKYGEQILIDGQIYYVNMITAVPYSILKVTEIPEGLEIWTWVCSMGWKQATPLTDRFDEQNW